jgi:hypothetical protein
MARDYRPRAVSPPKGRQLDLDSESPEGKRVSVKPPANAVQPTYEERVMTWMMTREAIMKKRNAQPPKQ